MKKLFFVHLFIFYVYTNDIKLSDFSVKTDVLSNKNSTQFPIKIKSSQEKKEEEIKTDIKEISEIKAYENVSEEIISEASPYLSQIFRDPKLNTKKISIQSGASKIQDIIELIGKIADLDFIIDQDVKGNVGKLNFKDVTPGYILNFILSRNEPPLALVKDMNFWRILLRNKAEEFVKSNNKLKPNFVSNVFQINHIIINDKLKDLIEKTWNNIVAEKKSLSNIYIDIDRKKIFCRADVAHIEEFKNFLKEIDKSITQIRIDAIIVFCQKNYNFDFGINWSGIYNRLSTIQLKKTPFGFVGLGGRLDDFPTPTEPISHKDGNLFVNPENFAINLFTRVFRSPNVPDPFQISNTVLTLPLVFGGPDLNLRRLNLLLNAAESESKVKIISRPSIITSDNEVAKILIGSTIPIQATTSDIIAVAVQNVTSINYKDVGIALEVHPTVSPDKKNIRLEIFIEESEVIGGTTRTNDKGIMQDPPIIDIIKVHNKVNLKNGQTCIIGGLSTCDERKGVNKVPFLNQLPLVGKLFTSSIEFKKEFEQYIFITPTIVENC